MHPNHPEFIRNPLFKLFMSNIVKSISWFSDSTGTIVVFWLYFAESLWLLAQHVGVTCVDRPEEGANLITGIQRDQHHHCHDSWWSSSSWSSSFIHHGRLTGALIEFHCSGSWLLSNWPPNVLEKYHIDILWWSMNPGLLSYAFFLSLQRLLKWSIISNLMPLLQASQECGKTLPGSLFATRTSGESTSCVDRGCYDRVSQGDLRSSCFPACKTLQCGQLDLCAHYGADGWGISMNLIDHHRSIESVICPDCHVHMSISRRRWLQRIPWGPLFPTVVMAHGS